MSDYQGPCLVCGKTHRGMYCVATPKQQADLTAAYERGHLAGRISQARKDAEIAENFDWRGMAGMDAYQAPQMIANRLHAEADKLEKEISKADRKK